MVSPRSADRVSRTSVPPATVTLWLTSPSASSMSKTAGWAICRLTPVRTIFLNPGFSNRDHIIPRRQERGLVTSVLRRSHGGHLARVRVPNFDARAVDCCARDVADAASERGAEFLSLDAQRKSQSSK